MKKLLLVCLLAFFYLTICAQEFTTYPNGMIYSELTMDKLGHIVDSLNLKYKTCEANPYYEAVVKTQITTIHISLKGDEIAAAHDALNSGMSLTYFKLKYPKAKVLQDRATSMRTSYDTKSEKTQLDFFTYPGSYYLFNEIASVDKPATSLVATDDNWLIGKEKAWYDEIDENKFHVTFVKILSQEKRQPIPTSYARMIQYGDCLIDTTTTLFLSNNYRGGWASDDEPKSDSADIETVAQFTALFKDRPIEPNYYKHFAVFDKRVGGEDDENWWLIRDSLFLISEEYKNYKSEAAAYETTLSHFVAALKARPDYAEKREKALKAVLHSTELAWEIDNFLSTINDKEGELLMKRCYQVMGACSQDQSPRLHLQGIAMLSAETANWEAFLRAHLDVMNDRVSRASDGSYAWDERHTYIAELEALGIDVTSLVIGSCLYYENPARHHYFGSVSRVGRALSETKHATEVEQTLLSMIKDPHLDDLNRLICYYLFRNYASWKPDEKEKEALFKQCDEAAKTLPEQLQIALKKK